MILQLNNPRADSDRLYRAVHIVAVVLIGLMPHAAVLSGDVGDAGDAGVPPAITQWAAPEQAVVDAISEYYAALTGGDVSAIESHVLDDERFVMLEGRHSNWGWLDYRDHHLAGELGDLSKVRFRLSFYRVAVDGALGYATFAYEVLPKEGPEMDFGRGFATAVLQRVEGGWKLRHLHTS